MNVKKITKSTTNFVIKRKAPIAFAAGIAVTGVLAVKLIQSQANVYDTWLDDKGLLTEFHEYLYQEEN